MAPGALEPKVKEMLYVAVSIAHGCNFMHLIRTPPPHAPRA